jgi:hypothetical protein
MIFRIIALQDPSGLIGMAFTGRHCTTQRSAVGRHSLSLKGSRHCTSSGSSMAEVTGDESEAVADSTRMQMFRRGSNPEDVVQNHGTDAVDNEETQGTHLLLTRRLRTRLSENVQQCTNRCTTSQNKGGMIWSTQ